MLGEVDQEALQLADEEETRKLLIPVMISLAGTQGPIAMWIWSDGSTELQFADSCCGYTSSMFIHKKKIYGNRENILQYQRRITRFSYDRHGKCDFTTCTKVPSIVSLLSDENLPDDEILALFAAVTPEMIGCHVWSKKHGMGVSRWSNGVTEIAVKMDRDYDAPSESLYIHEGRVYDYRSAPELLKNARREMELNCNSLICQKGCGCGCHHDLGFSDQVEAKDPPRFGYEHCNGLYVKAILEA
jgi:hypothetical protein